MLDRRDGASPNARRIAELADQFDPGGLLRWLKDQPGKYLGSGLHCEARMVELPAGVLLDARWAPEDLRECLVAPDRVRLVVKAPGQDHWASAARRLAREAKMLAVLNEHGVVGVPRLWLPRPEALSDEAVAMVLSEKAVALHSLAIGYLPGPKLSEVCQHRREEDPLRLFTEAEILQLITGAWRRLRDCHDAGVVHRDVGVHNLKVACGRHGEPDLSALSLFDFGYGFSERYPLLGDDGRPMRSRSGGVASGHLAPEQQPGWEDDPQTPRDESSPPSARTLANQIPIDYYQFGCFLLHLALLRAPSELQVALLLGTNRDHRRAVHSDAVDKLIDKAQLLDPLATMVRTALSYTAADRDAGAIEALIGDLTRPDRAIGLWRRARDAASAADEAAEGAIAPWVAHQQAWEAERAELQRELDAARAAADDATESAARLAVLARESKASSAAPARQAESRLRTGPTFGRAIRSSAQTRRATRRPLSTRRRGLAILHLLFYLPLTIFILSARFVERVPGREPSDTILVLFFSVMAIGTIWSFWKGRRR